MNDLIPPGYIGLSSEIDAIGRTQFGDDWRGRSVAELRSAADRLEPRSLSKAPPPISPIDAPSRSRDWRDEPGARKEFERWQEARRPAWEQAVKLVTEAEQQWAKVSDEMRRRLFGTPPEHADAIPAFVLLATGELWPVPRSRWYSNASGTILRAGRMHDPAGPVLLTKSRRELESNEIAKSADLDNSPPVPVIEAPIAPLSSERTAESSEQPAGIRGSAVTARASSRGMRPGKYQTDLKVFLREHLKVQKWSLEGVNLTHLLRDARIRWGNQSLKSVLPKRSAFEDAVKKLTKEIREAQSGDKVRR